MSFRRLVIIILLGLGALCIGNTRLESRQNGACTNISVGVPEGVAIRYFASAADNIGRRLRLNHETDDVGLQLFLWAVLHGEMHIFDVRPEFELNSLVGRYPYVDALLWLIAHDPISKSKAQLSDAHAERLMQNWGITKRSIDSEFMVSVYQSRWSLFGLERLQLENILSQDYGYPASIDYAIGLEFEERGDYLGAYRAFASSLQGGYTRSLLGLLRLERKNLDLCSNRGETIRLLALSGI